METRKVIGNWVRMMGDRWFEEDPEGSRSVQEVKCCGTWLMCDAFTNTCGKCGADYNMNADRLAPRSQWGEETGETYADIVGGW